MTEHWVLVVLVLDGDGEGGLRVHGGLALVPRHQPHPHLPHGLVVQLLGEADPPRGPVNGEQVGVLKIVHFLLKPLDCILMLLLLL